MRSNRWPAPRSIRLHVLLVNGEVVVLHWANWSSPFRRARYPSRSECPFDDAEFGPPRPLQTGMALGGAAIESRSIQWYFH